MFMEGADMPPKLSKQRSGKLKATVEEALLKGQWRHAVVVALHAEYGVSERYLYALRQRIVKKWRDEASKKTVEEDRLDFLMRMRGYLQGASSDKQWGNVQRLANLEAEIMGLKRPEVIDARTMVYAPQQTNVSIEVKVDQTLLALESQLPSMGLDQLDALVGQLSGGEVIDGDAEPANGGNGGGRPLIVAPSSAEEAGDGDPGEGEG
jgi:hypothetical protein